MRGKGHKPVAATVILDKIRKRGPLTADQVTSIRGFTEQAWQEVLPFVTFISVPPEVRKMRRHPGERKVALMALYDPEKGYATADGKFVLEIKK